MPALSEFGRTARGLFVADAKRIIQRLMPASFLKHIRTSRSLGPPAGSVYLRHQILRALSIRRDNLRRIPAGVRSVLLVCHGNIIRSPMAAALLRQYLSDTDGRTISIASAGLHARPSDRVDPRALIVAREFGISLDDHRTQPVTQEMVRQSDVIFVMDCVNEAVLLGRYPDAGRKVFLLGAIADGAPSHPIEIADPYRGDSTDIRGCYEILQSYVRSLAKVLFPRNQDQEKTLRNCSPQSILEGNVSPDF